MPQLCMDLLDAVIDGQLWQKHKGTRSAPGKIVRTEIITSTIKLLVQLKGVKEWIEQLIEL